jgi:cobalt-zinc-cadmium resistance protein CzcA
MVHALIRWAVGSAFIVLLFALVLVVGGGYAFQNVNVEAYPDPAPAIIEVVAQYPGFSAEEVERLVTIPLEVGLAGMPGLTYTRSKSLEGLSHLRNQFEYGVDYYAARQEVLNRLAVLQGLPTGVNPQISPFTPTGELVRYALAGPKGPGGRDAYELNDLKALQDWVLEREFKRLPRIADVTSFGGTVKRYEIRPDPNRLKRYGISLVQLQAAVTASNANIGAGVLQQKGNPNAVNVRSVGLIGMGVDPMQQAMTLRDPFEAFAHLRDAERERVHEIRDIVVQTVNNVPVRVKDLVAGGPFASPGLAGPDEGVAVSHVPRLGRVAISRPPHDDAGRDVFDARGRRVWGDEPDVVQGIVLMRKNEYTLPSLQKVRAKEDELNDNPGRLLPGVKIVNHFDLTGLIHRTTETVRENLLGGMVLVSVILFMFLSNVRSAVIVAVNIPLALLFAFGVMFLRGKSANLLSIGAVDFGIIVDSSVIMVENIYRHVSSGEYAELPLRERILRACREVERPLLFSTLVMVCAFIPLFTMKGPEGQIFGPMADTYAVALAGALLLALTLAPALCLLLFRDLQPAADNRLVQWVKRGYLRQLERYLDHRWATLVVFACLAAGTAWAAYKYLGSEFMPELEEGNLYLRATLPVNVSLDAASDLATRARAIMRDYPEVQLIQSQVGRPDDGTDPTGFYNVEFSVPLLPEDDWPALVEEHGWRRLFKGPIRARTKSELRDAMRAALYASLPGVDWNFSQYIRDNVTESLSGVKGDNSIKIIGPDIKTLEAVAKNVVERIRYKGQDWPGPEDERGVKGIVDLGIFSIMGQPNLVLKVDREKCSAWGVHVDDVQNAIKAAVGGSAVSQMIEGEKTFDITVRWPERLRDGLREILDIPVEVANNVVTAGATPSGQPTPVSGPSTGPSATGTSAPLPALSGSQANANLNNTTATLPRLRLGQLVTSTAESGQGSDFVVPGASTIFREQGKRLIAIKFSVDPTVRDLAGAVAEAQARVAKAALIPPGYQTEWSGEFQEMNEAFARLGVWVPLSLVMICVLVYLAFNSVLDTLVVLTNVVALSMGGVWALLLTGTNFSISAAVGFISIFGVAIMDGLLSVSYFNALRAHGLPLRQAIVEGAAKRVRPMMMTALTAIFGLLPAALSTRIGAQTQRPLAIVVVGGMLMTLLLNRYLMPVLYSLYGQREPPAGAGGMAH